MTTPPFHLLDYVHSTLKLFALLAPSPLLLTFGFSLCLLILETPLVLQWLYLLGWIILCQLHQSWSIRVSVKQHSECVCECFWVRLTFDLVFIYLFSTSVSFFSFANKIIFNIFLGYTYIIIQDIFLFLTYFTLHDGLLVLPRRKGVGEWMN